jgi:hypothetical protein
MRSDKAIIGAAGLAIILGMLYIRGCLSSGNTQQFLTKPAATTSTKTQSKQTVTTTRKLPGGESVSTTVVTEETSATKSSPNRNRGLHLGVIYPRLITEGKLTGPIYEAGVDYRLFGSPIFGGVKVTSEKAMGLTLRVEF